MTDLDSFAALVPRDSGLAVVSTLRADHTIQSSVVNVGVLAHPLTSARVIGFTTRGNSVKLVNLRLRPRATVVLRAGWEWAAAEGPVELAGPYDLLPGLSPEGLRQLLRDVFVAAGGTHDDWPTYDRVMADEERAVVMVTPQRVYSNA
jgi:PPOX class probable F420-dependent enzyme